MSSLKLTPLGDHVGVEISGIDLNALSKDEFSEIQNVFANNGVVFFRDQKMSCEQHIAFAEKWGQININRFFKATDEYPQIAEVRKEADQHTNIGGGWHTDHSYDEIPAMGSILLARELPPKGGDTMFASMFAAYEALSDGLKKTLEGLNAVHSSRHIFGADSDAIYKDSDAKDRIGNAQNAVQDAIHPIIISHPISGKKALYVNPAFTTHIEGWTQDESHALLNYLYDHAIKPEFTCRFEWSDGAIAMWDNRSTWHYALNDYHGYRRLMHRITVEGCAIH